MRKSIILSIFIAFFCFNFSIQAADNPNAMRSKRSSGVAIPDDIFEDDFFSAEEGNDMDQYLFVDHVGSITGETGMIEFYIEIDRYCGPVDDTGLDKNIYPEGGKLEHFQKLKDMGAKVRFYMYVFDVDDDYSESEVYPERDEVYVNGQKMPNILSSGNDIWKIYEVEVPIDALIFPEKGDKVNGITPAKNLIQIKVDVLNRGNPDLIWATQVDWAYFQFFSFPTPIVFIHGKGDNSLSWKIYGESGRDDIFSGGWYKWFEDNGFVIGAIDVYSEGDPDDSMKYSVVNTDKETDWGFTIHKGDWLDNDGDEEIDEEGERNVSHNQYRDWLTIPDNDLCFSDMISETTITDFTSYMNMHGVKQLGKMYGITKVHFVSHSTGCFYGRKYIGTVMNEDKQKPGFENFPIVDKLIMISGPNKGVNPETMTGKAIEWYLSLGASPCTLFYHNNDWKEFNDQISQNSSVNYMYIGGYSGWRGVNDIPDPLRPYCDLLNWNPVYGEQPWELDMAEQILLSYEHLGGKYGEDWENETVYTESTFGICYLPNIHTCLKEVEKTHIPNDGLVAIKSMDLGYGTNIANFPLNHHTIRTDLRVRDAVYDTLLPESNRTTRSKPRNRNRQSRIITRNAVNTPENSEQYTYLTGSISSSSVNNEELMILGGSTEISFTWDSSLGDLDIEVTDPEDNVISNNNIVKSSGHVIIIPSSFAGGMWKFKVSSGEMAQLTEYKILATMYNCDITLNPSTDKYYYEIGKTVSINAEYKTTDSIITDAVVSANVYLVEDGSLLGQINLYDDGSNGDETAADGIYTSNKWIPSQKGKERIEITAILMQDNQEFYRQSTSIMINVLENNVFFNGINSDGGTDTNSNGLYDNLKINIGITCQSAGTYNVGAELYDSQNLFIASVNVDVELVQGENTVELLFSGENIFENGNNSPFYLKSGVISSSDDEILSVLDDVYTTTNLYSYDDFEGYDILFSETQTDEGFDNDSNGKYNYLRWNFTLSVANAGTYNISATLATTNGIQIEIINDTKELTQGENQWSLDFDGMKINGIGINGPYVVDDVSLIGAGKTSFIGMVHTTSAYNYIDFEVDLTKDTDGDGTPDAEDGCPNDPYKTSPGVRGCGVSDTYVPPSVYVPPVNSAPLADAGEDITADEGGTVTLDASKSSDPDGNTISYQWEQTEGPEVTLSDTTVSQPEFTAPETGTDGILLTFRLTVKDTSGATDTDEVSVNVVNVLKAPIADAGEDLTVNEGSEVTLNADKSSDPEDTALAYKWTQTGGTEVVLSDPEKSESKFTAPDIGQDEVLTFRLEVSNEYGLTATDEMTVTIAWLNQAPTASAGEDQNVYGNQEVLLNGGNSSDPDDGIASYTWTQISGTSVTLSDPLSVQPSFAAPEVSADGETLVFELTVQDKAGLTAADRVTVNVMGGSSNQPPVSHAGEDQTVEEGSTVTLSAVNSTDNDGSIASYLWTQKEGTPVTLSDASNPQPTFVTPPTGSEGMSLSFEVTVTDDKGLQAGDTVAVTVNDNGITDFSEDVISFKTTTDKNEGIKAEKGYIVYLSSVSPDTIPDEVNRPAELPYGLTDIIVKCSQNGDTAEITVFLPEPAPENFGLYEYSEGSGWKEIIDNISFDTERKQIRLTLTDGGSGDSDGISDGMIHYLFGVGGNPSDDDTDTGSGDSSGSGGGGGSCFINTAEVSPVYKMVLTGIIFCMLSGCFFLNRRKN